MSTPYLPQRLELRRDGAELHVRAARGEVLRAILAVLDGAAKDQAGVRLFGLTPLRPFLRADGPIGSLAAGVLGEACLPVRAILFDKTLSTNWALGWHQDRVIAVAQRIDVEGFGPWSRKHGALHVAPPFGILERMITLRLHFDPTPMTNAPLLVAPGSHRFGRVETGDVAKIVEACGSVACTAEVGDAWLYATPILHASDAATEPSRRRVLQVDYSVDELPGGLKWLGV